MKNRRYTHEQLMRRAQDSEPEQDPAPIYICAVAWWGIDHLTLNNYPFRAENFSEYHRAGVLWAWHWINEMGRLELAKSEPELSDEDARERQWAKSGFGELVQVAQTGMPLRVWGKIHVEGCQWAANRLRALKQQTGIDPD